MDTDAGKLATAQAMIEAWNRIDLEGIVGLFAPDGRLHSMMEAEATIGRDALRTRLGALCKGATMIELEIRNIGVIGGAVFLERIDHFAMNGRSGSMPVVGVLEIEDGLVTEWRDYYDRATLLRGMGLERDFALDL